MSLAEFLIKEWREEVEESRHMFRTFGSSRNCNNCYFANIYKDYPICRRHITGIPFPAKEFKCSKWEKR